MLYRSTSPGISLRRTPRHIANQQRRRRVGGRIGDVRRLLAVGLSSQRHKFDVSRFGHLGLRYLHLHLVRIAADVVAPEIGAVYRLE